MQAAIRQTWEQGAAGSESMRSKLMRITYNLIPSYRATGAWATYLAADFSEVHVKLPLNWLTRNVYGTTFGGSMFAAADPVFATMLLRRLGPGHIVWSKATNIDFKKPGRSTLYARFLMPDVEIEQVRAALAGNPTLDRSYTVELFDSAGVVHATITQILHIRRTTASKENPHA